MVGLGCQAVTKAAGTPHIPPEFQPFFALIIIMLPSVTFPNPNFGIQTGINSGTINAHFYAEPLDKLPIADGAELGFYTDQHQEECLPGTRVELLNEIAEWAVSQEGKPIFWLNGMAGTGKSTISRTVARRFEEEKTLGASFFFKRGERDRGNAIKLFPTITRQLMRTIPQLTPGVRKAIGNNSNIGTRGLKEQFDKILLQPLLDLDPSALPIPNMVLVIDALDECDVDNDVRLILQLLPQLQNSKAVCLRVFLTSRPELAIRLGFKKLAHQDHQDLALHEIPEEVIERDLSSYLNHRLSEIREEREPPLPLDWPGAKNVQKLVALSVPLFIFAATICRIFEDPNWDPVDSLPAILTHQNDTTKLDGTYLPVLNRILTGQTKIQERELVQEFHQVVGALVILQSPLSVNSLSRLIGVPERLIHLRLNLLHSVLRVPRDAALPVQFFHLPFRDFLLDTETQKKTPFWINGEEMHYRLTARCLLLCQGLRRNICELPSDGSQRVEITQQAINDYLAPELQYACLYWSHHLVQSKDRRVLLHEALLFLQVHFLHWMEAMSIMGRVSDVWESVNLLQTAAQCDGNSAISEFLHDANRFILKNCHIADNAPLQIYCAGLVFAPRTAVIRSQFKSDLPGWICQFPQVSKTWSAEFQALEGHSGSVWSVTFSPNGRLLASGSGDNTVRLWDTATGALCQTLEGHLDSVSSVAFSPDGRLLASGSNDKTVRLWNVMVSLHLTLEGHSDSVSSVAFSPDGRLLASGSSDNTVQLWNTATGVLHQILGGHTRSILSVAFSSDNRLLASSSYDNIVRLWNAVTGELYQTLEGHTHWVLSVAFSPDGRILASGSNDDTVRLWDTATGALHYIIEGHSDSVRSVGFSPDSRLLASSSCDKTVRLWDISTGTLHQTTEGHTSRVLSVAFSPDGRLLASGSCDKTARLWETSTGTLRQTLEGHSDSVSSVIFSPDGRLLASGSCDKTARLWDTSTGMLRQTLEGHSDSVWSVAFSPDGRLLASGSGDNTVQLWDTVTGALYQTLEGHTSSVWSVAFSPDGRLLVSGSDDNIVQLWDTTTGALHQTLEGHTSWILSVAFSPDGRLLASGSYDNTVRLWDTVTGVLQETLDTDNAVFYLEFSLDSSYLSTNLGSFNIQSRRSNPIFTTRLANRKILLLANNWIVRDGEQVLFLPPDARPSRWAIKANTLALAYSSGRISFTGFRFNAR